MLTQPAMLSAGYLGTLATVAKRVDNQLLRAVESRLGGKPQLFRQVAVGWQRVFSNQDDRRIDST